jgi:hypothetical protein
MMKREEGYTHKGWMICRDSTGLWLLWPPNAPDGSRFYKAVGTLRQAKSFIDHAYFAIRSLSGTWLVGNSEWSDESGACQLFSSEAEAEAFAQEHNIDKFEIVHFEC